MADSDYEYPFDPKAEEDDNLIEGELHTISPPEYYDYYFIVPRHAPFFADELEVRFHEDDRELVEGVDYALAFHFYQASTTTALPIYGAISLFDRELSGTLEITYHTLGGKWAIDEKKALELLANTHYNPRSVTWEEVVELPEQFPVIDHDHHLQDLVGLGEVLDAIKDLKEAIEETAGERNKFVEWQQVDSDTTLKPYESVMVDTSEDELEIKLPDEVTANCSVSLLDPTGDWADNPVTVKSDGDAKIEGQDEVTLDKAYGSVVFVYTGEQWVSRDTSSSL